MTKKIKNTLIVAVLLAVGLFLTWRLMVAQKVIFLEPATPLLSDSIMTEANYDPANELDMVWLGRADVNFEAGFGNEQLRLSLERYFVNQEKFSWETQENSWRHCTVKNLEEGNELFPFSVWVYCGEYIFENNKWRELSGSSGPVKIDYPNELSYYNDREFTHQAPRDGAYYSDDLKNIFSEEVQKSLAWIDIATIMKANRQFVLENSLAWENIKKAIAQCQVKEVFQAHSLEVRATLKDGTEVTAMEPKIDEIMDLVTGANCRGVIMATE